MTSSLKKLFLFLAVFSFIAVSAHPVQAALQGAADYRSSLTTGISSTDTSLTAVSTSTASGENLLQGYLYGLKLGGREYAIGTLGAGKTFTSLIRGASNINGTTTGGLAQSWGRGTSVEVTDAPLLIEILNKIAGRQFFDNALRYTGISTSTLATNGSNLASVDYVNDVAFGAIPEANESTAGFSELATGAEAAASTSVGGSGSRLVLPASIATSTYNSATAGNVIPVTDAITGKLDENFIATTTLFTNANLFGTTTAAATSSLQVGAFSVWDIGKQFKAFTSTGTTTFSVPSGITKVRVITIAGGGNGGGCSSGGSPTVSDASPGGNAGGTSIKNVNVTGTSTIQVYVGAATAWSTFGTNGYYTYATAGGTGADEGDPSSTYGIGVNGDINIQGGGASYGYGGGGKGGDSYMGGGGGGRKTNGNGSAGGVYGGGGGGAYCISNSQTLTGGAGAQGAVFVSW